MLTRQGQGLGAVTSRSSFGCNRFQPTALLPVSDLRCHCCLGPVQTSMKAPAVLTVRQLQRELELESSICAPEISLKDMAVTSILMSLFPTQQRVIMYRWLAHGASCGRRFGLTTADQALQIMLQFNASVAAAGDISPSYSLTPPANIAQTDMNQGRQDLPDLPPTLFRTVSMAARARQQPCFMCTPSWRATHSLSE